MIFTQNHDLEMQRSTRNEDAIFVAVKPVPGRNTYTAKGNQAVGTSCSILLAFLWIRVQRLDAKVYSR